MKSDSRIVVRSSSIMLIGMLVRIALEFALRFVVGRTLGAEEYGIFSLAYTVFQAFTIFSLFGLYITLRRFIPEYRAAGDKARIRLAIGTAIRFGSISSIISFGLLALASQSLSSLFSSPGLRIQIIILAAAIPFYVFIRIFSGIATSFETTTIQSITEQITLPLTTIITFLLLYKLTPDLAIIPLAFLNGYIIAFLVALVLSKKKILRDIPLIRTACTQYDSKYVTYSIYPFLYSTLFFIMNWTDTLFLGYFSSERNVGIYNIAIQVAKAASTLLIAVNAVFLPTISRLIKEDQIAKISILYSDIVRILSLLIIPFHCFLIVYTGEITGLFGKDFIIAPSIMIVLSIGTVGNILSGPIDVALNAFDRNSYVVINTIVALLSSVILNWLLVPSWPLLGAAIAASSAMLIQNYLGVIELYKDKGINFFNRYIIRNLVIGLAVLALTRLTYSWIGQLNILPLHLDRIILGLTLTYTLYCAFIVLTRNFQTKDIDLMKSLVRKLKRSN